jgi:hypothetical protein
MPYIKQVQRNFLDPSIDRLADDIVLLCEKQSDYMGLLNYSCTRLALLIIKRLNGRLQYHIIASLIGVFRNIADEIYRRIGVPYERIKITENGDVDEFKQLGG